MAKKKNTPYSQQRTLRRYQIIMGFIGVVIILSMIISLIR